MDALFGLFVGLLMFIAGIAGFVFVRRREFYRRNVAGNEEFESYGHMVRAGFLEGLIKLISLPLLILGLIVFLVAGFGKP